MQQTSSSFTPVLVRSAVAASALLLALSVLLGARAPVAAVRAGDPLPGLTPDEMSEFQMGLDDFLEVETSGEGLGPAFNGASCAVCHNVPAVGGGGTITELRAGRRAGTGPFQPLHPSGETLFQLFSIPTHGCQAVIPPEANVVARRLPIPLFGGGLVEAIPDETLLAFEDPTDRDGDGVSGRAARIVDLETGRPRIGRFGWKAQHASLLAFGADAYRNEMGITNDLFPHELALGVSQEQMRACDLVPDPEDLRDPRTRRRGIDNFASYMRLLAPLDRTPGPAVKSALPLFTSIGCAACHIPALETGPHPNPLFDRRTAALFSDLLLHDVGTGDGIPQGDALPEEMRTPSLWGLRFRRLLLHDGSAVTIEDAIARHGGEATAARQRFFALGPADRTALLALLKGL